MRCERYREEKEYRKENRKEKREKVDAAELSSYPEETLKSYKKALTHNQNEQGIAGGLFNSPHIKLMRQFTF